MRALALILCSTLGLGVFGAEVQRAPLPAPNPAAPVDVGIKQLGYFEYNPMQGGGIPADVLALSGARVRMRGTITPWRQGDKITEFALTDGESCCYGRPPMIQHVIAVTFPAGIDAATATSRVVVEGTLKVDEKKADGWVTGLFTLQATSVTVEKK